MLKVSHAPLVSEAVGAAGEREVREALLARLGDDDWQVREAAVAALAKTPSEEVVRVVARTFLELFDYRSLRANQELRRQKKPPLSVDARGNILDREAPVRVRAGRQVPG